MCLYYIFLCACGEPKMPYVLPRVANGLDIKNCYQSCPSWISVGTEVIATSLHKK